MMVPLMNIKAMVCCTALTCIFTGALSQAYDSTGSNSGTEGFIKDMGEYIGVKLNFSDDIERFELRSPPNVYYDIRPNSRMSTNIFLNFRFIGVSLGITPSFLPGNNDDDLKGKSSSFSLGTHLSYRQWFQYLAYGRVKGFFLHNTDDYIDEWEQGVDEYILFPELVLNEFRGHTGYRFNPRYSLKSTRNQSERQLKSAGSFLPVLSYRYYIIDNKVKLTGQNSSQRSDNLEMILSVGYYYNLVLKQKFYISLGLSPGAGFIHTWLLTRLPEGEDRESYTNFILRGEGQLALGYNSERFYAGGQAIGSWAKFDQAVSSSVIVDNRINYQIFAGYRFVAPGFLNKTADRAERLLEDRGGNKSGRKKEK
jgi:hypothetical protein